VVLLETVALVAPVELEVLAVPVQSVEQLV
jgi:hypothetical protein